MNTILADIRENYARLTQLSQRSFGIGISGKALALISEAMRLESGDSSDPVDFRKKLVDQLTTGKRQFAHGELVFNSEHGGYDVRFSLSNDMTTGYDLVEANEPGTYAGLKGDYLFDFIPADHDPAKGRKRVNMSALITPELRAYLQANRTDLVRKVMEMPGDFVTHEILVKLSNQKEPGRDTDLLMKLTFCKPEGRFERVAYAHAGADVFIYGQVPEEFR